MNSESVDTYISANKYPPQDAIKEYIKLLAPSKVVIKGEEVYVSFKNGAKHISHDIINNKGKIKPENIRRLKTFLENAKPSSTKYETDNKDFGKRSVSDFKKRIDKFYNYLYTDGKTTYVFTIGRRINGNKSITFHLYSLSVVRKQK